MYILGISAFYHDSAAAIVRDGEILDAAQEERFTRKKHDFDFPAHAVRYCLAHAGIRLQDVDYVVFYDKPFLKFERLIETWLAFAPRGYQSFCRAAPIWLREKLFQKSTLVKELKSLDRGFDPANRLLFTEHHYSHAASAFFPSPFPEAAILTADGAGEWATTSGAFGSGNKIRILKEMYFPHSLGLLYSAFTYYTGFQVNDGEYKLMGLAPYGEPRYSRLILDNLIDLKPDGSFRLNLQYFDYCTGLRMTNGNFERLFNAQPRPSEAPLTKFHADLAASIQHVLEEAMLRLTRALATETGARNLCLAGGVALNCVSNGKILRDGAFDRLWVQPGAGDAGGAIGAALAAFYQFSGQQRTADGCSDTMKGAYLGPAFEESEIESHLCAAGARYRRLDEESLLQSSVDTLASGKVLAWFQGRMEFGPRALGARSILADARSPSMQSLLNLKVKRRESFRPFAPAVLRECAADWFDIHGDSPYMSLTAPVLPSRRVESTAGDRDLAGLSKLEVVRSEIPAVTHVDYTARLQTVDRTTNPLFHALLSRFAVETGCPVLLNTSFNVRGEPIVCTPEDALRCFRNTDIDAMAIVDFFVTKED